jgi:hypothetical protein
MGRKVNKFFELNMDCFFVVSERKTSVKDAKRILKQVKQIFFL